MRLLERYILIELCRVFAFLLILITSLFVLIGVYEQARQYGMGPWHALQIIPFIVPRLLPYTIPVALLLTTCVVYGRLAGDREIIAAKAAGIPVLRLIWPSIFLGSMLSVGTFYLTDQLIPWSTSKIQQHVAIAMEDILLDILRSQGYFSENNLRIIVNEVRDRILIEPVFRYSQPWSDQSLVIKADESQFHFDVPNNQILVTMKNGWVLAPGAARVFFDADQRAFQLPLRNGGDPTQGLQLKQLDAKLLKTEQETERLKQTQALESAFDLTTGNLQHLNHWVYPIRETEIRENQLLVPRLRTEYHNRFAMSLSSLFFVMVGSPFSILSGNKQFLTSFLFVFTPILLVYYPVMMMMMNLSRCGSLDPSFAVWAANCLLLIASGVFLQLASRN